MGYSEQIRLGTKGTELDTEDEVMALLSGVVWAFGEDAKLRRQLSRMGFVYASEVEAMGMTHGAKLQPYTVQAAQVEVRTGTPLETHWCM